jgi:hypothetical protein
MLCSLVDINVSGEVAATIFKVKEKITIFALFISKYSVLRL